VSLLKVTQFETGCRVGVEVGVGVGVGVAVLEIEMCGFDVGTRVTKWLGIDGIGIAVGVREGRGPLWLRELLAI